MVIPHKIKIIGDEAYARDFLGPAKSQMRILEDSMRLRGLSQGARQVQLNDRVHVTAQVCFDLKEIIINCPPVKVKRGGEKREPRYELFVMAQMSGWATVWELETGELAQGIVTEDGDEVEFPCEEEELTRWLRGTANASTRQKLKVGASHSRDYVDDNGADIGNENRVELFSQYDPSRGLYYGVIKNPTWEDVSSSNWENCQPVCCYAPGCVVPLECETGSNQKKWTPSDPYIVNCSLTDVSDTFYTSVDASETFSDCYMAEYSAPYRRCRRCDCFANAVKTGTYLQIARDRSKFLYLKEWPSNLYHVTGSSPPEDREYTLQGGAAYPLPIKMACSTTNFACHEYQQTFFGNTIGTDDVRGDVYSLKTDMGWYIADHRPVNGSGAVGGSFQNAMQAATALCSASLVRSGFATRRTMNETTSAPGHMECGSYSHATSTWGWCREYNRSPWDRTSSESNRTAISWCGSPTPGSSADFYRVLLAFHMGGFHTSGVESSSNAEGWYVCPDQAWCDAHPGECDGDVSTWTGELESRYSSVQATIEIEKPGDYEKIPELANWWRSPDFAVDPSQFDPYVACPGRTASGVAETETALKCFPYDGTYVIQSLGKAVEDLINNHYEDESDDKLIVHLCQVRLPDKVTAEGE